jgi:hypothetical protein
MEYIFVAIEPAAGSRVIKGPISGRDWLITPQGSWILDEFERDDRVLNVELYRYCTRSRSDVKVVVYLTVPSFDQMEQMPTMEV